jgi:signal recognition particle subunit SRP54
VQAQERLLVISADIGQAAQKQAQQFHDSCHITGVIATKMDGTAKAGGALSACAVTGSPIKFIGVGEKIDDLEQFNPPGFVGRLLGMGDLEALLEKAKEAISEEEAEDLGKRLLKGDFTLIDLYEQMEAMSKMGPLSKLVDMIPGFGQLKMPKEMLQVQEGKLKKWKIAMQSMTKEELEEPDKTLDAKRIERISKGSGISTSTIRELVKQYRQTKKLMKMMKGKGDINKLMKKFQGKLPKGFGM